MKNKIVAIMSGGDWNDASVDHLVLNSDIDLKEEKSVWDKWYEDEYLPAFEAGKSPIFHTFVEWLIHKGLARKTKDSELEEFWDM